MLIDIDKAISAQAQALNFTPDDLVDKAGRLSILGSSYQGRFERSGDLVDIDEAISVHERAVRHTPDDHVDMRGRLDNLGCSFSCRFERSGDVVDLTRPSRHTSGPSISLPMAIHASLLA